MKSKYHMSRISRWVIAMSLITIVIVKIAQMYLSGQGRDDIADLIGVGVPIVLVSSIIIALYLWAFLGSPPVDPLTVEKISIIEALIDDCLEEENLNKENLNKEELLECIREKLREKGEFTVTSHHIKEYMKHISVKDMGYKR